MTQIEHCNITVPDIDSTITFLRIAAPDFNVRKDERPLDSYRWVHIGNDNFYIALQQAHLDSVPKNQLPKYINYGVNHIAMIVPSVEEVEKRLSSAGYKKGIETPSEKFRKRVYFIDHSGFEWEFVEYLSDRTSDKFLYE